MGNYNEDFHRTIKADPGEVWSCVAKNKQDYQDIKYDFQKGDKVRVLYKKELFAIWLRAAATTRVRAGSRAASTPRSNFQRGRT